ncbi:MAG: CopD family protein [Chloroflexi bacterium]|nr:CopD family protein [Chloroflexota bacterium]
MRLPRLLLALSVLLVSPVLIRAHGYVVRAIPADRSTLERPPTRLQYWFSEALEPRFSEINLRDQTGKIIASGGVDQDSLSLLSLRVPSGLPDGAYIVELRPAFASDGHVIAESRVFFVGEEVGGVSGRAADDRAIPLEVFWRYLLGIANTLFFGGSFAYAAVLLPAWGSAGSFSGGLPSRVMGRLRNCFVLATAIAISANLLALIQQSMVFFNADASQVVEGGLWQVVQIGSRFGDIWTFRMVLLVFTAVLIFAAEYIRETIPQMSVGIWKGMIWLGALFIGLSMISSHAAGSLVLPWIAILVNWIHALAVAGWVGGLFALTLVLPIALDPYAEEERRRARAAVLMRFSRVAKILVMIVIVSGAYNALNYFASPAEIATSYGSALGRKLLLVVLLLLAGGWQHLTLRPRLLAGIRSKLERVGIRFREEIRERLLRLEVLLALATLLAVSWLSATPIPAPQSAPPDAQVPQATGISGDFTISAAALPGGPGVNTYDLLVSRAGAPVAGLDVYLQLVHPEDGRRSPWQRAEEAEAGLYVAVGDDIDRTGTWWTLVDVVEGDGQTRAAFSWQISASAAVVQTREANLAQIISLAAVLITIGGLAYPAGKRLLARMRLGMASCLLAGGAVVVTLATMGIGAALIAERQRDYERTLNPPPEVVNVVLPDAESLARGAALYQAHCLVWQGQSADFRALRGQLGAVGDDFLYAAVRAGWRDLPPCSGELGDGAVWDIVNFFRGFEGRQ